MVSWLVTAICLLIVSNRHVQVQASLFSLLVPCASLYTGSTACKLYAG